MNISKNKNNIQNKKHMLTKEISSILRSNIEDIVCIENSKENIESYSKIMNIANKIGTIYFAKSKKSFRCLLFSIGGITIVVDDSDESEFIFIRSSDLDLL